MAQNIGIGLVKTIVMQRAKEKQKADILGPVACAWAYKLEKQTHCTVDVAESKSKVNWKEPEWVKNSN
jgi:hypothetical protein